MSGGQRQRVAIARALVRDAEVMLADEPTAALDQTTGQGVMDLMKRLNRERGVTFVFSTHDPRILSVADRVIQLRDGRVIL
jgi:putative ABC transport system ATP-binding protein